MKISALTQKKNVCKPLMSINILISRQYELYFDVNEKSTKQLSILIEKKWLIRQCNIFLIGLQLIHLHWEKTVLWFQSFYDGKTELRLILFE